MSRWILALTALATLLLPSLAGAQYYYPSTFIDRQQPTMYWPPVNQYPYQATTAHLVSTPYRDVPSSHPNAHAIVSLSSDGIIHGISSGIFWPDKYITRAEAAKVFAVSFLPRSVIDSCPRSVSAVFFDVPGNVWFTKYVCAVKAQGWMTGVSYGTFAPEERLSLAEMGKVLSLAKHYNAYRSGDWYTGYVQALADRNAIPTTLRSANEYLTRGEFAEILYRVRSGITNRPSLAYDDLIEANIRFTDFTHASRDAVGLTISVDDDEAEEGQTISFSVRVQNRTGFSQRIRLEAVHARDLEFVSSSSDVDRTDATRIIWDRLTLRSGEEEELSIRMRVRRDADRDDELDFRIEAQDDDGNHASATEFISVRGGRSRGRFESDDLTVSIDTNRSSVRSSEIVSTLIRVRNDTGRSQRVDVRATLDDDLIVLSADRGSIRRGHTVEWNDFRMDDSEEEVFVVRSRVSPNARRGDPLAIDVTIEDDDGNSDRATDTIRVEDDFFDDFDTFDRFDGDLSVDVTADEDLPEPGDAVTLRIRIDNDTGRRQRVDVEARLDRDLDVISVSHNGRELGSRIEWTNVAVDDRDVLTLQFRARVASTADDGDELEVRVTVDDDDGREIERTETLEVND